MGFSLASLGSQLWMMYLTFGLMSGIGHGLIFNSSYLVILQYFVNWRSLAVGIVASAPAIGMFAITQTTQMLLSTFGWRGTLRGYAFLFFVCGLCATVFTPLDQFKKESKDSNSAGIRQRESKTSSLFRNRYFLILFTSLFVVHMSYFVPTIHIVSTYLFHVFIMSSID